MSISELITELKKFKAEHGDINVVICDEYGNCDAFDCFIGSEFNPFSGKEDTFVMLNV